MRVYFLSDDLKTSVSPQNYLCRLSNDPVRSRLCKTRILCRTLAGNLVYLLTITSEAPNAEEARAKRAVVLSSRVHPGESNASWMMKGFLDYLTGPSPDAKVKPRNSCSAYAALAASFDLESCMKLSAERRARKCNL